ncbi:hypothetical protein COO59_00245 [Mixta theicola]|uniref:Uncharacterized protein n=1 Tax=Mixta theicola TaxID=1458355 RepID=A0A2K1QE39_9GAMM|nr:hypothetical protein [Mixta theicola]PNS13292.1 hypothetical protein COO59_00245 [Mixta theicola]GLR09586.1 hypothetical protein GCM10007905_23060 [Mixta theicola]
MKEEEASLMLIRHAIDNLPQPQKERVMLCISRIKETLGEYEEEDAGLALMLVAAEIAAE